MTPRTQASDRDTAAELAQRIKSDGVDLSKRDEADRAPGDRPPGYADALMSETPASIKKVRA